MMKRGKERFGCFSALSWSFQRTSEKALNYGYNQVTDHPCNNFLKTLLEEDTFRKEQIKRRYCEAYQRMESPSYKRRLKNLACLTFKNKD